MAQLGLLETGEGPGNPATLWPMFDGQRCLLPAGGVMLLKSGGIRPQTRSMWMKRQEEIRNCGGA